MNTNAAELIRNDKLVKALDDLRKQGDNEKTVNRVVNELLNATLIIPANLINSDKKAISENNMNSLFVKLIANQDIQASLPNFSNEVYGNFVPVFTDMDQYKLFAEQGYEYERFSIPFNDISVFIRGTNSYTGCLLNPYTHGLPITKDMFTDIEEAVRRAVAARSKKA